MGKLKYGMILTLVFMMGWSCSSPRYHVNTVEKSRILIDSRYDASPDAEAAAFLAPYKHTVDSMMSPIVGKTARYMAAARPEGELSNLLADILIWGAKNFNETPDFAVYNMGGIRAAFAQGDVTIGDVIDVAPFENKISFVTMKGEDAIELFGQIAKSFGQALSHGVELVITADGKMASVKINGKEIDPQGSYRVATLDYLAQGNDGLTAFKKGTDRVMPSANENNVRYIIMDYFREQTAQGKVVDSEKEGRVIVQGNPNFRVSH